MRSRHLAKRPRDADDQAQVELLDESAGLECVWEGRRLVRRHRRARRRSGTTQSARPVAVGAPPLGVEGVATGPVDPEHLGDRQ